jgi:N-acetylated-alpha-linked acidic dipeptidase
MAGGGPSEREARALNTLLQGLEQRLTSPDGLPRRPWFRHMIYAPGFWTGYGVKTLPGVREGIEQREWNNVSKYVGEISDALDRLSSGLEQATGMLGS